MNEHQIHIMADFTRALGELDCVMETISKDQLDWSESPGEWSIRQVLHHLTDDGNVFTFIIERALATPGCKVFFSDFPGNEAWSDRLAFNQRPIDCAWDLLHAQRRFLAELVSHCPERWENSVGFYNAACEKQGEQNVEGLLMMLTEHMQEHNRMIENILAANLGG
jgi:hypothetical protein